MMLLKWAKLLIFLAISPALWAFRLRSWINTARSNFVILGRRGDLEWAENECSFYTPPSPEMQAKYKAMNKTWRVQNTYILDENGVPKITYGRIFIRYTDEWIANHPDDFKEVQQQ